MTGSLERALAETSRRRDIQIAYNTAHGITPQTIKKSIQDITEHMESDHAKAVNAELSLDIALFKKTMQQEKKKQNVLASSVRYHFLMKNVNLSFMTKL